VSTNTLINNDSKISGNKIKNGFGYIEASKDEIDFSIIYDLITKGDHNGKVLYVIRDCVPEEWTKTLTNNFNNIVNEEGSHRNNDGFVLVQQLGSSQFAKTGQMYIEESHQVFDDIAKLFLDVPSHIIDNFFMGTYLEDNFLKHNKHFGPSRFKHGFASMATFRRWLDNGVMSLMPHEDKAQLAFAVKDSYEIARSTGVVAQNLCMEASGKGGELVIWNIQPDDECRDRFNVQDTGYPYPPDSLKDIESVSVKLNPGDIYFMNACCVHGVSSVSNGSRLTAGRFIGALPNNKVVYWT